MSQYNNNFSYFMSRVISFKSMVWYKFKVYLITHNFFPDSNVDCLMDSKINEGDKRIDLSFISLKSFNKSIV